MGHMRTITVSFTDRKGEKRHYNIPTVFDGVQVPEKEAIRRIRPTLKHRRSYKTHGRAIAAAKRRSEVEGKRRIGPAYHEYLKKGK